MQERIKKDEEKKLKIKRQELETNIKGKMKELLEEERL
jgi:sensor domain CHASE-containing protein